MNRFLVQFGLVTALCGFTGNVGENPNPLTFWWYATAPEDIETARAAIECAAARWRAATCLPVDVSFDAHHWVRFMGPELVAPAWARTTGTWESARIKVRNDRGSTTSCGLVTHEMGHVMARNNGHTPQPEDVMYYAYNEGHPNRLTQASIDYVCSYQQCGCSIPEP